VPGSAYRRISVVPAAITGYVLLLLTDVIMPGMSRPELAEALRKDDPTLRVLLMSGYPEDRLGEPGSHARSAALLAKPYAPAALVKAVRDALEEAPRL
jgi:DNA-binding NarL/FixJ family response regulator